MSQRVFHTTKYRVCTGWDVELQHYSLVIQDHNDEVIFMNLDLRNPAMRLVEIGRWLWKFDITPPLTLYLDLISDCHNNSQNVSEYQMEGTSK